MTGIGPYLAEAIDGFLGDPPDSEFQRGYLRALLTVYREALGRPADDPRLLAAERLLAGGGAEPTRIVH